MRVKRYVVDSMPEALEKIRQDLGQDAIIINTKPIKTGGWFGLFSKQQIEVIAALDVQPKVGKTGSPARHTKPVSPLQVDSRAEVAATAAQAQPPHSMHQPSAPLRTVQQAYQGNADSSQLPQRLNGPSGANGGERTGKPSTATVIVPQTFPKPGTPSGDSAASSTAESPEQGQLISELRDIREMFQKLLMEEGGQRLPAPFAILRERLVHQEVEPDIISALLKDLVLQFDDPRSVTQGDVFAKAKEWIISRLGHPQLVSNTLNPWTRYAYFFGPTGVGKTTTIAKLAAESMLRQKRKVGFITSDTFRIAAVEQLKTYANILNAPLEVVYSPREMDLAMERLDDCNLLLVDTAGRNFRNEEYVQGIKELIRENEASENFLVLSLTSKFQDIQKIVTNFSVLPIHSVIFTKSDETEVYGTILNVVDRFGLSLSFITTGQNVPDDIVVANPELVADMILGVDRNG